MAVLRTLLAGVAALFGLVLSIPVIVVGSAFFAVSLLSRVFCHFIEPRFVPWTALIEFDPTFGWKPKAHLNTHHLVDDVFHMTTDAQGWRGKASLAESDIVVFGDSFAWGCGIDDKDFFSDLNPHLRIKPVGTNGYNMVQEFLWMQRLSSQLKGKLVVWFVYFGNDLYENLVPDMCGYRMPFVREANDPGDWEVVTSHISPAKWLYSSNLELRNRERDYYGKLAELCSATFLARRAYAACEYLIRKARELCDQAEAQLVLMTIPDQTQLSPAGVKLLLTRRADPKSFDSYFPDRQISEICQRLGVPHVALKDHLDQSHYKESDCHWNRRGHRQVAEVLSYLYHHYGPTKARAEQVRGISHYRRDPAY